MFSAEYKSAEYYSDTGYRLINGCLRGYEPCPPDICDHIANLDKLISVEKANRDLRVYRGVSSREFADFIELGYRAGSRTISQAFVSTSARQNVAGLHSRVDGHGAVIEILIPRGTNMLVMGSSSTNEWESEILLARGTKLMFLRDLDAKPFVEAMVV